MIPAPRPWKHSSTLGETFRETQLVLTARHTEKRIHIAYNSSPFRQPRAGMETSEPPNQCSCPWTRGCPQRAGAAQKLHLLPSCA